MTIRDIRSMADELVSNIDKYSPKKESKVAVEKTASVIPDSFKSELAENLRKYASALKSHNGSYVLTYEDINNYVKSLQG